MRHNHAIKRSSHDRSVPHRRSGCFARATRPDRSVDAAGSAARRVHDGTAAGQIAAGHDRRHVVERLQSGPRPVSAGSRNAEWPAILLQVFLHCRSQARAGYRHSRSECHRRHAARQHGRH